MSDIGVRGFEAAESVDGSHGGGRNYAILDQLLRDSCVELMADYGLPATPATPIASMEPAADVCFAAIDFSGRDLRGTIGLRMTSSVPLGGGGVIGVVDFSNRIQGHAAALQICYKRH